MMIQPLTRSPFAAPCRRLILALMASVLAAGCSSTEPNGRQAIAFNVTDLGAVLGSSPTLVAMNDSGQIVGTATINGASENVLYQNGAATDLGSCQPVGINDHGAVACANGSIWQHGTATPLSFADSLHVTSVVLKSINDAGEVAGIATYSVGASTPVTEWFVWGAGQAAFIPDPSSPGQFASLGAVRENRGSGVLIYTSRHITNFTTAIWSPNGTSGPAVCDGEQSILSMTAVSASGEAVGQMEDTVLGLGGGGISGMLCENGKSTVIDARTYNALDISRNGVIVGATDDSTGYVWIANDFHPLDTTSLSDGWTTTSAELVNDNGQIVATGVSSSGTKTRVLLTLK